MSNQTKFHDEEQLDNPNPNANSNANANPNKINDSPNLEELNVVLNAYANVFII
jgi:hypothetical protein